MTAIVPPECGVDPRLAFLERASARLLLVESGEMEIGEAFDGLMLMISCTCVREMVERWEMDFPAQRRRRAA